MPLSPPSIPAPQVPPPATAARLVTRRLWSASALAGGAAAPTAAPPVSVPVLRLLNRNARCSPAEVKSFHQSIWQEAVRIFRSCDVTFKVTERTGEIRHYPSGRPQFLGLERPKLNLVLTDAIPLDWDSGRSLGGVSVRYEGYDIIVISLKNAHPNRFPLLALNTLVHELLHVFLGDIFIGRPGAFAKGRREAAADWQATRLWLFGGSSSIHQAARQYVRHLLSRNPSG